MYALSSSVYLSRLGLSSFPIPGTQIPSPLVVVATSFLVLPIQETKTKQQAYGMEVPAQGHEAALRTTAAQSKPPANARPWPRGGGGASAAPPPPPPKVYRVEPREFRDLVQRLTGAPPTALRRAQNQQQQQHPYQHHHQRVGVAAQVVQPQPVRPGGGSSEQVYGAVAAPWFSFPMAGGVEATTAQPQHGAFL